MIDHHPIAQIAYSVPDVRAAAKAHSRLFGSGPFFVIDHLSGQQCWYRDQSTPVPLELSVALGQWGDLMVEIWHQTNDAPSHIHDLFPFGTKRSGLHHVALLVDDTEKAVEEFRLAGHPVAFKIVMPPNIRSYFMDTVDKYGHFIELYGGQTIRDVYAAVREASVGFDGQDPIREWEDFFGAKS